jgi:hypothetical protein
MWMLVVSALLVGSALAVGVAPNGRVFLQIADRGQEPIPILQDSTEGWPVFLMYLVAFVISSVAYIAILRLPRLRAEHVCISFIVGAIAACALPFFTVADPYAYALYALEAGPLGLNPYAVHSLAPTASHWSSALMAIFSNRNDYIRHCNYGPLHVFAYAALALPLAHFPLVMFLYAERLFGAFCVAVTGLALARNAPVGESARRAAMYVLHPLVLFEFVAFAHGDALMLALLVVAFVAWRRAACGTAGALCVAALTVRSVAALGLVALLVTVARTQRRALGRVVAGATVAALIIGSASFLRFGTVSLGGLPAFNPFSAPFVFAATALELPRGVVVGVVAEAAFGAFIVLVLLRRAWSEPVSGSLSWLPFGALAAIPAVCPHYVGWVAGVAALHDNTRFNLVARVATFVAPVWYLGWLYPIWPPAPVFAALIAITWGSVVIAIVASGRHGVDGALRSRIPELEGHNKTSQEPVEFRLSP